jgi:hypothetical protein
LRIGWLAFERALVNTKNVAIPLIDYFGALHKLWIIGKISKQNN